MSYLVDRRDVAALVRRQAERALLGSGLRVGELARVIEDARARGERAARRRPGAGGGAVMPVRAELGGEFALDATYQLVVRRCGWQIGCLAAAARGLETWMDSRSEFGGWGRAR